MKDQDKTKEQLIDELVAMRQRTAELEAIKAERARAEKALRESQSDITEQLQMERVLQESEEKYYTLVENSTTGIFASDAERFAYVNPRLCEITGFSMDELLNMTDPVEALFAPEERERVLAFALSRLSGDPAPPSYEARGIRKDGEEIWLKFSVSLIILAGERVLQGVVEDITEYKRVEAALKAYSERLEEMVEARTQELQGSQEQLLLQEKLAALGQLAAVVTHELRNPLGVIKGAAYLLNLTLKEPNPEIREALEILRTEVNTCVRIVDSLLDIALIDSPAIRKVDPNYTVREALFYADVPQSIEVVTQLDEALPTIQADPDQLGQIFGSLILNAVQAMTLPTPVGSPAGGRLTIRTLAGPRPEACDELSRVGSGESAQASSPEWVTVSITDTGMGIPEEDLEKIFEPFFTTRSKGIGLGLTIGKTLVEANGGCIEVASNVGEGSTFTVRLPVR